MKTPEQIALEKQLNRLTKRFHKACADYQLIADDDHILIGLSGGKDSLLLTELLGRRAQIYKPSSATPRSVNFRILRILGLLRTPVSSAPGIAARRSSMPRRSWAATRLLSATIATMWRRRC